MVLFTEGDALPMSFEDDLLWCPDNDGRLVDLASCLDASNNGTAGPNAQEQNGNTTSAAPAGPQSSSAAAAAAVLAAMEQLQQQSQLQNDANNNISSSSSSSDGGHGNEVGSTTVHCDLANLDSLEGEPEEILRQLAENPFEIEYFFSDMPGRSLR